MTALDLDAIEARANAAAEGPWKADLEPMSEGIAYGVWDGSGALDSAEGMIEEDAEFIAHAREDVPALVAEVRRLSQRPSVEAITASIGNHGWTKTAEDLGREPLIWKTPDPL